MKPGEVAAAVLEIIPSARYWRKHGEVGGNGAERHCLIGSYPLIEKVTGSSLAVKEMIAFQRAFLVKATEVYPNHPVDSVFGDVTEWNDDRHTTYEMLRVVLEKLRAG